MQEPTTADSYKAAEYKRRRRELIVVCASAALLAIFALAETLLPPFSKRTSLASNIIVILLFNLSFILAALLVFLVGRNLAKVFFEHRSGIIGSKLQARLVVGFLAASLFPSLFLLYVAESFLRANINAWFDPEYEKVLNDSLSIAKTYYLNAANQALHYARELALQISKENLLDEAKRGELRRFIADKQAEYALGTIEIFSSNGHLLVFQLGPQTPASIELPSHSVFLSQILRGEALSLTEHLGKSDVIRGGAPIFTKPDAETVIGAVVVDYYLPRSLVKRANSVSRSFYDYLQLRTLKRPIFRSYILVLVLIALVVALLASWFGIYLARGITRPIKLLAEGTQAIASGDLDYQITPVGDDEIAHLVRSFNRMTADLKASQTELERRQRALETLLHKVPAGVVAVDAQGCLLTINPCAEKLLNVTAKVALGQPCQSVLPEPISVALSERLHNGRSFSDIRSPIQLDNGSEPTELMMTVVPLEGESGVPFGYLLFFEDVSQIAKIERMEAWREVAQRVAHEIKNPLTPIRLCAERIRRNLSTPPSSEKLAVIDECTLTILNEVESLKHLVDEFSSFARLPHLNPVPGDLNAVVAETTASFREAHPHIRFDLELEPNLPPILLDREAMRRALVNLLDNAAAAVTESAAEPWIGLKTFLNPQSGIVTLEVADNGPGIKPHLKARIFEPYFSTKKDGAGLGLAIVSAIVADHHGFVRVWDNVPTGTRFVLEFPIKDPHLSHAMGRVTT